MATLLAHGNPFFSLSLRGEENVQAAGLALWLLRRVLLSFVKQWLVSTVNEDDEPSKANLS